MQNITNNGGFSISLFSHAYEMKSRLSHFHGHIVRSFDKLPEDSRIKELCKRILLLLLAPLAYTIYSFDYLISRFVINYFDTSFFSWRLTERKLIKKTSKEAEELQKKIEKLKSSKDPEWQDTAVKLIHQGRHEDAALEILRLRVCGMTEAEEIKIMQSLRAVKRNSSLTNRQGIDRQIKVIYGQALELKKIYKNTHHVFIHAQASEWLNITYLINELVKQFQPEVKNRRYFKFIRSPEDTSSEMFIKSFLKNITNFFTGLFSSKPNPKTNTPELPDIQTYVSTISEKSGIHDHDTKVRKNLLSVDAYFYNYSEGESALSFLINNVSMYSLRDSSIINNLAKELIKHFCPGAKSAKQKDYVERISKEIHPDPLCGNLFVICIAKENSSRMQYVSHPFGAICMCHEEEEKIEVLEKLQNDQFDASTKCKSLRFTGVPQYRIYTPALRPNENTKIHLLSPLAKKNRDEKKKEIKKIVNEMYALTIKNVA